MNEKKGFVSLLTVFSILILIVIVLTFVVTVSGVHLAKGSYAAVNKYSPLSPGTTTKYGCAYGYPTPPNWTTQPYCCPSNYTLDPDAQPATCYSNSNSQVTTSATMPSEQTVPNCLSGYAFPDNNDTQHCCKIGDVYLSDSNKCCTGTIDECKSSEYTITFHGTGGSTPSSINCKKLYHNSSQSYTYECGNNSNNEVTLPSSTRSGYTFLGWSPIEGSCGSTVTGVVRPTSSTNYYACWEKNTSSVLKNCYCNYCEGGYWVTAHTYYNYPETSCTDTTCNPGGGNAYKAGWGTPPSEPTGGCNQEPTQSPTQKPSTTSKITAKVTGCYSCNSGVRYVVAGNEFPESCNTSAPVSGYSPDGNSGFCSRTYNPTSTSSQNPTQTPSCVKTSRGAGCYNIGGTYAYLGVDPDYEEGTCDNARKYARIGNYCPNNSSTSGPSTSSQVSLKCYCNTCNNGTWESYELMTTTESYCRSAVSDCNGTNAVTSWGYKINKNGCPNSSNPTQKSNASTKNDNTSNANNTINNDNTSYDASNNPQTGNIGVIVAWLVGLLTIIYTLWYFKKCVVSGN